jgi:ribonuclease D
MIIQTQAELTAFCKELAACPYIMVDTEFLREKTYYPKLCLIQLGTPEGKAAAVDPLIEGIDLQPVFDLLLEPKILKVIHAGRQDLEIFYNLTGKVVTPFFDTQIAAMVCGYGDSVGYESLVRNITGAQLDKSVQFTNWSLRPLTKRQLDYALGDVIYLAQIYRHLKAELDKQGRTSWVFQEEEFLADPATYENHPEEAWQRIKLKSPKPKMLVVLRELAAWRETQAQHKDLPRPWIMRDETLADMAAQAPRDAASLAKIRGVSEDMAKGNTGKVLLDLIGKALDSDKATWPKPEKKDALPAVAQSTLDILKMLLKIQSTEHGVAAKLIADKDELEDLAMNNDPNNPVLKGWRFEVFGRDALEIKNGRLAIGLKGSKIAKYKVSKEIDTF